MVLFPRKFNLYEFGIGVLMSFLVILGVYFGFKSGTQRDYEYNSYLMTEVRYYEPYETYVYSTCSRQVACGTDSKGNTTYCTEYYDCSYCDSTGPSYRAYDSGGNEFSIDERFYNQMKFSWGNSTFVELNRDITYHGFCGKDGDMYSTKYTNEWNKSITTTLMVPFDNPLLLNTSAFSYSDVDTNQGKNIITDYPYLGNFYQSSVYYNGMYKFNKQLLTKKLDYFNGKNGKKLSVKVFLYIFEDKPISQGLLQQKVLKGGNQNEVIVTVGTDKQGNITWVYPFSWTENKRLVTDLTHDVADLGNVNNLYRITELLEDKVSLLFKWRNFKKEFDYVLYSPTNNQIWTINIVSGIVALLLTIFFIKNDFDSDDDSLRWTNSCKEDEKRRYGDT